MTNLIIGALYSGGVTQKHLEVRRTVFLLAKSSHWKRCQRALPTHQDVLLTAFATSKTATCSSCQPSYRT